MCYNPISRRMDNARVPSLNCFCMCIWICIYIFVIVRVLVFVCFNPISRRMDNARVPTLHCPITCINFYVFIAREWHWIFSHIIYDDMKLEYEYSLIFSQECPGTEKFWTRIAMSLVYLHAIGNIFLSFVERNPMSLVYQHALENIVWRRINRG